MEPVLDDFNETEATDTDQEPQTDTDRTDGDEEATTTPSQSRSSSIRPQPQLPLDDDVDVFDGYSFKGRESVFMDDEDEEEDGSGEEEEDIEEADEDILDKLEEEDAQIGESESAVGDEGGDGNGNGDASVVLLEDDGVEAEPKTPEARPPAILPSVEEVVVPPVIEEVAPSGAEEVVTPVAEVMVSSVTEEVVPPVHEIEETTVTEATEMEESQVEPKAEEVVPASPRSVEELDVVEPVPAKELNGEIVSAKEINGEVIPPKELNGALLPTDGRTTPPPKAIPRQPAANRAGRNRREKSGVPALDRYLSDGIGETTEAEHDEDDDWDFIEAADGEDRNGAKGTSLFARGVVDRYRLAVFRKASTPTTRSGMRSVSGMSNASGASEVTESPSPSQRRGRTPLTFRKSPRQFLRPKSPPSSFSAKSARTLSQSASSSNILSAASTSSGGGRMLSASHSVGSTFALPPSLKSKESAMSVGAQSQSSDQSVNGTSTVFVDAADTIRGSLSMTGAEHKVKNKKLRKYKHNAEKVFSLFSSPRQAS